MVNKEFQEAKRLFSIAETEEDKVAAVDLMRKNLLMRNNEVGTYTLSYTTPGQTLDINDCSVEALFAIDGDMNPQSI